MTLADMLLQKITPFSEYGRDTYKKEYIPRPKKEKGNDRGRETKEKILALLKNPISAGDISRKIGVHHTAVRYHLVHMRDVQKTVKCTASGNPILWWLI